MPQQKRIVGIGPGRGKTKYEVVLSPTDQKALERIGYFKSTWDRMNWYVGLAQLNLANLTNGEILSLQEEFIALERKLFAHYNPSSPTLSQIQNFQQDIHRHLANLADKGTTEIGPLTRSACFANAQMLAKQKGITEVPGILIPERFYIYRPVETSGNHALLHNFVELLEEFNSSITRCPHCLKLFLQFRRNAIYCSRSCQSVAIMRKLRQPNADKRGTTEQKQRKKGAKR